MPDGDADLERVLALRGFPGIDGLSLPEVSLIASNMVECYLPAGTLITGAGSRPSEVHFVMRGRIESRSASGAALKFGPRSIFGLLSALSDAPARSDAVAAVDTSTLVLDKADIEELLDDNFTLVRGVIRALGNAIVARLKTAPIDHMGLNFRPSPVAVPAHALGLAERILVFKSQRMGVGPKRIRALSAMAHDAEEVRLDAGTTLWRRGDPADVTMILLGGQVRLDRAAGESWLADAVQVIGSLETVAKSERWYDAVCVTEVRALRVDRRRMVDVLADHTHVARDMVLGLARALDRLLDG